MKCAKIVARGLFCLLAAASVLIFGSIIYLDRQLSDSYKISEGESLQIESVLPISITNQKNEEYGSLESGKYGARVKLFGLFPARNITVDVVDDYYVSVLGSPFGIKIYTDGVLVVGFKEVLTADGKANPARDAGIKEGDFIMSLGGTTVYTNEEVMEIIKNSNGETLVAKIVRENKKLTLRFKAALDSEGVWRAGMWVKDSSAGIGTLTFYSPTANVVAGLGHGIADGDTGTLLSLNHGEFVQARIIAVEKGTSGTPGELKGRFQGRSLSGFSLNSENGVYGIAKTEFNTENLMRIAMKQEVKSGSAKILTTVDNEEPRYYSCDIKVKDYGDTQNLLVEITDKALLDKTGGIVQGMSGSPIIQNGKLIGAVTHVLIDDPTKGYGIFAENMLETAQSVSEQQLQNAS